MGLEKLSIQVEHSGEVIRVLFNPEEYSLSKDNNFAAHNVPGLSSPILQFVHGNLRTLTMELFFDTSAAPADVRDESEKVVRLASIDSELHAPPVLLLSWGSLLFRGVLTSVGQTFTRFLADGRPVRARLDVSFSEVVDPEREAKQVNRQTADFAKLHVVAEGDTLAGIAARYYDAAGPWRAIALANGIDDPRRGLWPGRRLRVPSLPFVHPATGEVLR